MSKLAIPQTTCLVLTNKSGGARAFGDVVVMDPSVASAFDVSGSNAFYAGGIGVVMEPNGIADNAVGAVAIAGYVPQINLQSGNTAVLGDFIRTYASTGKGYAHVGPTDQGDFAICVSTGSTPAALLLSRANAVSLTGPGDEWTEIVKTADQDVTNSSTLANDTELLVGLAAGSYHVRLFIMYSGDSASGDYKCGLNLTGLTTTITGWYKWIGDNGTTDAVNVDNGNRITPGGSQLLGPISAGCDASHTVRHLIIEAFFTIALPLTAQFQFAQNAGTAATSARTKKGSILRYRKLPT